VLEAYNVCVMVECSVSFGKPQVAVSNEVVVKVVNYFHDS